MYSSKVVLALKSKGKVLREVGETVYLPFGSEYSILIKNLNSVRVAVKIKIDGIEATEGVQLLVNPNSEIELERFIKNGNLNQGNRFKFIERNAAVEAHRGIRAEDGLVCIEYQFERPVQPIIGTTTTWPPQGWNGGTTVSGSLVNQTFDSFPQNSASYSSTAAYTASTPRRITKGHSLGSASAAAANETGVTAPGSVSNQQFAAVSNVALEAQVHTMVLQLKGEQTGTYVTKPVTVQTRVDCVTCGLRSTPSATVKFCSRCGTSLQIVN